ncbi:hypothetical protein BJX96DRAFT_173222 [Aspergillus floccosus]
MKSLALLTSLISASHYAAAYQFRPETDTAYWKVSVTLDRQTGIPLTNSSPASPSYSTSVSQLPDTTTATSSYWTSSYITSTDNQQYLVISHLLIGPENRSCYRASALNLHNPAVYTTTIAYTSSPVLETGPHFRATVRSSGFEGLSADNVAQMRTFSADSLRLTFDLTYAATSTALANGGMGLFSFGGGRTYEWGLPNCVTAGSAMINGQRVLVDPARSFTWYDRQWSEPGAAVTGNWTWFELHVAGSRDRLSVWAIDGVGRARFRFATIRREDGAQIVVPVGFGADYTRQWYSRASGTLYPLDWVVTMGEHGVLRVASIVGDQEIAGNTAFSTAYKGFVTFDGQFEGQKVDGFGVVEIVFSE